MTTSEHDVHIPTGNQTSLSLSQDLYLHKGTVDAKFT